MSSIHLSQYPDCGGQMDYLGGGGGAHIGWTNFGADC